jgi:hypothetical protein
MCAFEEEIILFKQKNMWLKCYSPAVRSCLLRELTASQLVTIVTRSDTGSHNILDLMQCLVPPHYVCNGYLWSRVQQYWTRLRFVQYCCTLNVAPFFYHHSVVIQHLLSNDKKFCFSLIGLNSIFSTLPQSEYTSRAVFKY